MPRNEQVTSRFSDPSGDQRPPQVVNVSAEDTRPGMAQPRDWRDVQRGDIPGAGTKRQRSGTEVDSVTGQALQAYVALRKAAANPGHVIAEMTGAQMRQAYRPSPDEVHQYKSAVLHSTVTDAPGLHECSGPVGGGLHAGTAAPQMAWLFGLDRGR